MTKPSPLASLLSLATVFSLTLWPTGTGADQSGEAAWDAFRATGASQSGYRAPRCLPSGDGVRETTWSVEGMSSIAAMQPSVVQTLQRMETRFDGISGRVATFRPGADYAEVYIRDLSTILPAAQYFYGPPFLEAGIGEFLATQFEGRPGDPEDALWVDRPVPGAVSAIIRSPEPVKMTVVSDEETSLIHAAYVYYRAAGGTAWLGRVTDGVTRLDHLNAAIDWLWSTRTDPGTGLVKRRHTTDWGDVAMEGGNADGSLPLGADVWVASIYDQAVTYQALRELAVMNRALGQSARADLFHSRAEHLREASVVALWQPSRGVFRTHLHLTPLEHPFDEDAVVSIANAHALYTHLADVVDDGLVIKQLEQARVRAGVAKPGLALYPPYVSGLFGHPNMGAWSYQNGGVWDWWGGMQVTAEFQRGYSAQALFHLQLIANDWQSHGGGVWEWQHPLTHRDAGSPDYAGAAATAAEAVISGLFGVDLESDRLWLGPRLGARDGALQLGHPASGCWLRMTHSHNEGAIDIVYETNLDGEVRLSALVPEDADVTGVRVDEHAVPTEVIALGDDRILIVRGLTGGKHQTRIELAGRQRPSAGDSGS